LPAVRARVIKTLVEEGGLSLSAAARILQVSVTSAAKYKRILEETPLPKSLETLAEELGMAIIQGVASSSNLIESLCRECIRMRANLELCRIHKGYVDLPDGCVVCMELLGAAAEGGEKLKLLRDLRIAVSRLASHPGFALLVPEVRTNLVARLEEAMGPEDVAGFPGRLTVVDGRLTAVSPPVFGASKHMARLLLAASQVNPSIRAALCIRFDDEVKAVLDEEMVEYASVKGRDEPEAIRTLARVPPVVAFEGGFGAEPVAYIFGADVEQVVELALRLSAGIIARRRRG